MIDVDYNEYKEALAENMKLIVENHRLEEVEKEHQKLNGELREEIEKLKEENKELKQKVKYYENFEINKTVDKIRLENNKREKELQLQLQQKENIIKEVREYIETEYLSKFDDFEKPLRMTDKNDWNKLLEILDKENKQ